VRWSGEPAQRGKRSSERKLFEVELTEDKGERGPATWAHMGGGNHGRW
jgi:hypothetical protein